MKVSCQQNKITLFHCCATGIYWEYGLEISNIKFKKFQEETKDLFLQMENVIKEDFQVFCAIDMLSLMKIKEFSILMQVVYMLKQCHFQ